MYMHVSNWVLRSMNVQHVTPPHLAGQRTSKRGLSWPLRRLACVRRRRDLASVSNVCEVATRSVFCEPNRLNDLQEVRFEFPFNLIGKSTMAFLSGQSWRVLKSWYTGAGGGEGGGRTWISALSGRRT